MHCYYSPLYIDRRLSIFPKKKNIALRFDGYENNTERQSVAPHSGRSPNLKLINVFMCSLINCLAGNYFGFVVCNRTLTITTLSSAFRPPNNPTIGGRSG